MSIFTVLCFVMLYRIPQVWKYGQKQNLMYKLNVGTQIVGSKIMMGVTLRKLADKSTLSINWKDKQLIALILGAATFVVDTKT